MTDLATVRIADGDDWDEIFRLLRLSHAESGLFPFDLAKVEWWMKRVLFPETVAPLDIGPRGVVGVIGEPGQIEGLAFLIIGSIWYSSMRHLEELVVFVEPQHRPRKHAQALIEWMKEQSRLTGLPLMSGVMSTERTEAKVRLYSRSMGPPAGAVFRFDPLTMGSSISLAVH